LSLFVEKFKLFSRKIRYFYSTVQHSYKKMVGIIDIVMILVMVCLAWAITSMVLIISKVEKGGTRINFFLIKLFIFKYISQYNEMTKQEKGKVGPLFYHFIVPMWLAFAGVLIWIIFSL